MRVIISGGGTGGHIFPAIAIANEFRRGNPNVEILFVGAKGKMEEVRVPAAGYDIELLDISGFDRGVLLKNVRLPFKIIKSLMKVKAVIKRFRPDVVIGVGGFASAPTLYTASKMGIPTFIQEQNAYPGVTNKIVGRRAKAVFTAYEEMDKFFEGSKVIVTGNPVRSDMIDIKGKRDEALCFFDLRVDRKTLLIVGGSLGARSINEAILSGVERLVSNDIQLIWQTGKWIKDNESRLNEIKDLEGIRIIPFIERMDLAYAAADVIISRAGAIAISELCCIGKPVIFVPFPYASEDHQTKNAMFLVNRNAGICIEDKNVDSELISRVLSLFNVESSEFSGVTKQLSENIKKLAHRDSAKQIVEFIKNYFVKESTSGGMTVGGKCVDSISQNGNRSVFLIGIGGIGMSALARYYKSMGMIVSGYDSTASVITNALQEEGIAVYYENNIDSIDKAAELVIYTPAVKEHVGYDYYRNREVNILKRAEALAAIVNDYRTIAVAGTHGKTTTSTMVAHVMKSANVACNSFLGGISSNYETNLLLDDGAEIAVTEADEFDRSFLKLTPSIAVITSVDADHLDIYNTEEQFVSAFREYALRAKDLLIVRYGLKLDLSSIDNIVTYSIDDKNADCYAENVICDGRMMVYDIVYKGEIVRNVRLLMSGYINVENSLAAFVAAKSFGVDNDDILCAFKSFRGVRRRFDFRIDRSDFVYVDDYCHHPSEIKAFVTSMRAMFPDRKLTGVFQPHLYSRTKDFADGFADSLSLLDRVVLLEVYPAREKPIAGVNSQMLLDKIKIEDKYLVSKENLIEKLKELKPDVLMTMGAGDIDRFVSVIENEWK